jgi:hypothetical protein
VQDGNGSQELSERETARNYLRYDAASVRSTTEAAKCTNGHSSLGSGSIGEDAPRFSGKANRESEWLGVLRSKAAPARGVISRDRHVLSCLRGTDTEGEILTMW